MPLVHRDKDATQDFGRPERWKAVGSALYHGHRGLPGGDSLSKMAYRMGLGPAPPTGHRQRYSRRTRDFTVAEIEDAVRSFHRREGRAPSAWKDKNATQDFGFPETWEAVNSALRQGGRGLPGGDTLVKVAQRLNLRPETSFSGKCGLQMAEVEDAIRSFHEREGRVPLVHRDKDATQDFDRPETWAAVDKCLRLGRRGLPGGDSLPKMARRIGLATIQARGRGVGKPYFTETEIEDAVRLFYEERGRSPSVSKDKDATSYFGRPENWPSINRCLGKGWRGLSGGDSLPKMARRLGLR